MKNTKLIVEYEYDFDLFGLISSAKDYNLAWHLNNILHLHLCKAEEIEFDFLDKSKIYISNFIFEKEYSSFRLLKNKAVEFHNSTKPYILPECKEYDYLLMLKDEAEEIVPDDIMNLLKSVPVVQYVNKIDLTNLRSKENLIFN
jgi:hypothetical protein